MEKTIEKIPMIKAVSKYVSKTYTEKQLESIKADLVREAEALFAGSTDAGLMVQKIEAVFRKYL